MNRYILPHDRTPPDPDEAIEAHTGAFERAREKLRTATTDEEINDACFWLNSASREIARWQAKKAEAMR